MLSGSPPFAGTWQHIVMEKMAKDAPSLASRWPDAPAPLVRLVARCLSRDPAARPATAESLLRELHALAAPSPSVSRGWLIAAGVVALAAIGIATGLYLRERRIEWVHATAIPTIERLDRRRPARLGVRARERGGAARPATTPRSARCGRASRRSRPSSASPPAPTVTRAALERHGALDSRRHDADRRSAHPEERLVLSLLQARTTATVTVVGAHLGGSYVPIPSPIALRKVSDPDTDMVLLRGKRLAGTLYGLPHDDTFDLADFLMDAREVTNRQYKAFVDAGGYAESHALGLDDRARREADPMGRGDDASSSTGPDGPARPRGTAVRRPPTRRTSPWAA